MRINLHFIVTTIYIVLKCNYHKIISFYNVLKWLNNNSQINCWKVNNLNGMVIIFTNNIKTFENSIHIIFCEMHYYLSKFLIEHILCFETLLKKKI